MTPGMKLKSFFIIFSLISALPVAVRAAGGDSAPVPVRAVAPEFPYEMRREGVGGVVTIKCVIDEKGNVQEPEVQKASNEAFVKPAMVALMKWKFKPARKDGVVVAQRVTIPIQFSIKD